MWQVVLVCLFLGVRGQGLNIPQGSGVSPGFRPNARPGDVLISNDVNYDEPTFFVIASKRVRPGHVYKVAVNILKSDYVINVRASIQRDGVEVSSDTKRVHRNIPEILLLKVPGTSAPGRYRLKVQGNYEDALTGVAFMNETDLKFSQRSMTILIQMDKPIYKQGQIVRFRSIPITTSLKAFDDPVDVYMIDPNGYVMRRWLSRQSNIGAVSLEYALADQVVVGSWKIRVIAQGQVEERSFKVEEYFQTRFEVNVSMPASFVDTDSFIHGYVEANYTSGAPVRANLTLRITMKPFEPSYRLVDARQPLIERFIPYFHGHYHFKIPMYDLASLVSQLDGMEVKVLAIVGDPFYDEIIEGYSSALVFNSSVNLQFMGSKPQVFKPTAPFKAYLSISYYDNSQLPFERQPYQLVEVDPTIIYRNGAQQKLETHVLQPIFTQPGIFELEIDLLTEPRVDKNQLNNIKYIRLQARYRDDQNSATAEMLAVAQYAPFNHHLSVSTSTTEAKVGEYIIFHVRADFYVKEFSYVLVSKGIIIHGGTEALSSSIRTFAVALSPEMAPSTTIVVYHISNEGEVVADSLTFPVNGISRNKFNVSLNNYKEKQGNSIEVVVWGEPGAYVGISAMDRDMYTMQAGNELSHAHVLLELDSFESDSNGTIQHLWRFRTGEADRLVHYPSPTYGIDTNRTFAYAGLVIFTDAIVPRVQINCDPQLGLLSCLNGMCYSKNKRCNNVYDCEDGSDESNCPQRKFDFAQWHVTRRNRFERLYQNFWLWSDFNVGPLGHHIFNISVPERPAYWVINSFSMSKTRGFGILTHPLQYAGARPFYMTLEMPSKCMQGEQLGLRVSLFNFMDNNLQVMVILANSKDYKFVHVGQEGIVYSYSASTSGGEHQHLIWLFAQSSSVVYMPMVPTRLGDINVTVQAVTPIGKFSVSRILNVDADGIPQYRHASTFMDLSNHAYMIKFLDVNLTEVPVITYQKDRYYVFGSNRAWISVFGDVVGPSFPNMPMDSNNLLRLPGGSGENNMFNFAFNLLTIKYMRITNQRRPDLDKQAFYHLNRAYARQMSYQGPGGSFKPFRWNSNPSVWLTAFCARIFHEANFNEWEFYLYIDPQVIIGAVNWLLQYQTPYGAFYETTMYSYDRKMNLTSDRINDPVRYRNISLTAHVLITLLQVRDLPGDVGSKAANARNQALAYLERMLPIIKDFIDPFELAITSYALTLAGSPVGEEAFNMLSSKSREVDGMVYWGREATPNPEYSRQSERQYLVARLPYKYDASNIETTAYALLTYVERQALMQENIVHWLNYQRLTDGGWASTQDSLIALQALMEYTIRSRIREVTDLTVTVKPSAGPLFEKTFVVHESTMSQLQKVQIPNAWGSVDVLAKGAGMAVVQLSVQYHVDVTRYQTLPPIQAFAVYPSVIYKGRNSSQILMRSCQKWTLTNESIASGMAVLEVDIPTGYIIQQQDLDAYVLSQKVRNLRRARYYERKAYFYFEYLDDYLNCLEFTMERWYPVANVTRFVPVKVYDYYAPERFNETMFDMYTLYMLDICQVCGSYQCPYCPTYNFGYLIRPIPSTVFILGVLSIVLGSLMTNFLFGNNS
uniref:Macroglobulin complement-related 2 n=1 Tax=Niponia nodulosa TaxID=1325555 RepID=A0A0E4B810_9MYRI|nr:macroglobulin complement-related 2 [Niponia nodulosa]